MNVKLPEYAKTGRYIAKIAVQRGEIGRGNFQVEEFMPDRIKVTLTADKPVYSVGDDISIDVDAVNLFGPPAINRKVLASCDIEASEFTLKKWDSFTFSNAALKFKKRHIKLLASHARMELGKGSVSTFDTIGIETAIGIEGGICRHGERTRGTGSQRL